MPPRVPLFALKERGRAGWVVSVDVSAWRDYWEKLPCCCGCADEEGIPRLLKRAALSSTRNARYRDMGPSSPWDWLSVKSNGKLSCIDIVGVRLVEVSVLQDHVWSALLIYQAQVPDSLCSVQRGIVLCSLIPR